MVNFGAGPLTVPQGCWRVLSLQLLDKALPVHLRSSLRLDSSLGAPLSIPLYLQSGLGKVNKHTAPPRRSVSATFVRVRVVASGGCSPEWILCGADRWMVKCFLK